MGNTTIPAELVAINAIQGTLIADNAITAVHIAQNQVHSVQLAINSVTATQIADSTITSAKIADGTIVTADIADGQITTAKLVDSSVTSAKIAAGTIVGGDIANNAILTQHIDDNQITADQIADNAVGLGQMAGLTRGSIIYGDSAGDPAYLAAGTSGHVLTSDGTDISWTADTDLFLATAGGTLTGSLTSNSSIKTTDDIEIASAQPRLLLDRNDGSYSWNIYNGDGSGNFPISTFNIANNSGTAVITALDNGNVGIGTTNPSFGSGSGLEIERAGIATLRFQNTSSGKAVEITQDSDFKIQSMNSASDILLMPTANVGIGTSSPAQKLDIAGTAPNIRFTDTRQITWSGLEKLGGVEWHTTDTSANGPLTGASIYCENSVSSTIPNFNMVFATQAHNNASAPIERMRINSSGQVGIGLTPNATTNFALDIQATSGGNALRLKGRSAGGNEGWLAWTDNADNVEAAMYATADNLIFANTTSYTERMRIDASGNVLIGTTSNSYTRGKFTVFGTPGNPATSGTNADNVAIRVATTTGNSQSFDIGMYNTGDYGAWLQASNSGALDSHSPIVLNPNGGNVGIGDTSPSQRLSVSGTSTVPPARFTAAGNTNTLEVWGNATASTSTGILCNAGTNSNDYSAKFRNYAGSTIMEVRGDSLVDTFGGIRLQDSNILAFGQSSDTRIYYDGTDSLYITAVNGTADKIKTNANNTYIMQANGNQLITAIANSEVIINNDSSASVDFRVESDNQQYNFFCDASSEIIHFGEGTNSDVQQVIPAGTLAGRRHGYHGGNRTHAGQTFKYCEGTSWTDAIKIDWNNASWGGVCMRITGQYYYSASNNFSIVIGLAGYDAYGSVSYDATSNGVLNWTNAIQLAQTANGETMIRQRTGDSTGDVVYRYEWQTYNRSDQTILIVEQ